MICENCERLRVEQKINSDTIARIAQDNRALRAYVDQLEREIEELKERGEMSGERDKF